MDGMWEAPVFSKEDFEALKKMNRERMSKTERAVADSVKSIYYSSVDFMNTKRFKRFVNLVYDKGAEIIFSLGFFGENKSSGEVPSLEAVMRDAVVHYTEERLERVEKNDFFYSYPKEELIGTAYGLFHSFPVRKRSNLWALHESLGDDEREDAIQWNERSKELNNHEQIPPFALRHILSITRFAEDFESDDEGAKKWKVARGEIFIESLYRACYDYVSSQIVAKGLNDETWYRELKNISEQEILLILSRTVGNMVEMYEDWAFYCAICLETDNSTLEQIRKLSIGKIDIEEKVEDYKQEREELLDSVKEAATKCRNSEKEALALRTEVARLKNTLAARDSADEELRVLRNKLKQEQAENAKLKAKNEALERYADSLREEESEQEGEAEFTIPDDIRIKRIVFVRDKQASGHLLFQRLAEMFPNARFSNLIASDVNAKTTDLIVNMVAYTCHGTFWGAVSTARRKDIPSIDISNKNVEIIAKRIVEAFQSTK